MGGSSLLWLGSSIGLDPYLKFLAGLERNHAAGGNGDFLTGFRVTARTLAFVAQVEVAEPRQLHLLITAQAFADLIKEQIHHVLCLTLVETKILEQFFSQFCFGQSGHANPSALLPGSLADEPVLTIQNRSLLRQLMCAKDAARSAPGPDFFYPDQCLCQHTRQTG